MTEDINYRDLAEDICFSYPHRTKRPDWTGHLPFAYWIIKNHAPKTIVELGVFHGDSYIAFCDAIVQLGLPTKIFGVDTWQGDVHISNYPEEIYKDFCSFHDPRYSGFSTLMRMFFDEAVSNFADSSIDLLHIDGQHTYESVKEDFETWFPKVSDNGIILFHDTNVLGREDFGVWKVWQEICEKFPHFEFKHGNGLGVLAKNKNISEYPEGVRRLFQPGSSQANVIQTFFSRLGGHYSFKSSYEIALTRVSKLEDRVRDLRETNNGLSEAQSQSASMIKSLESTIREQEEKISKQDEKLENFRGMIKRRDEKIEKFKKQLGS